MLISILIAIDITGSFSNQFFAVGSLLLPTLCGIIRIIYTDTYFTIGENDSHFLESYWILRSRSGRTTKVWSGLCLVNLLRNQKLKWTCLAYIWTKAAIGVSFAFEVALICTLRGVGVNFTGLFIENSQTLNSYAMNHTNNQAIFCNTGSTQERWVIENPENRYCCVFMSHECKIKWCKLWFSIPYRVQKLILTVNTRFRAVEPSSTWHWKWALISNDNSKHQKTHFFKRGRGAEKNNNFWKMKFFEIFSFLFIHAWGASIEREPSEVIQTNTTEFVWG